MKRCKFCKGTVSTHTGFCDMPCDESMLNKTPSGKFLPDAEDVPEDRTELATGGVRDRVKGKGRYDLVPEYPIERLAKHYERAGDGRYPDRNWELGLPLSWYVDSAQRHLAKFKMGDRTEDHLAAVLWNVAGYLHTENEIALGRLPVELNDVPWPYSVPK